MPRLVATRTDESLRAHTHQLNDSLDSHILPLPQPTLPLFLAGPPETTVISMRLSVIVSLQTLPYKHTTHTLWTQLLDHIYSAGLRFANAVSLKFFL